MSPPHDPSDDKEARFRWQGLFQHVAEPLFLLNRRRQILFVNRAWETLTGLHLADVKGQVCRRRPRGIVADKLELLLGALAPPAEVVQGLPGQTRRLLSAGTGPGYWQIAYFPLAAGDGLLGILGKITVLPPPEAVGGQPLSEKMLALRQRHAQNYRIEEIVGESPVMTRLREQIRLAAQTGLPVLLVGPPGAGKQWVARAIHQLSPRREQPYACLDCARLPPHLLADLLFGVRPSFASVYLRNLDALPRDLQERLRQRLSAEDESVPRVCAGLECDPEGLVAAGTLLHELYCGLSALVFQVPALKERMEDFDGWLERLLPRAGRAADRGVRGVNSEANQLLRTHAWRGNLRELYDVLVGACLRARGELIEAGDLPFYLRHAPLPANKALALDDILQEVERRLIIQALRLAKNNKSGAAQLLTIWRARLLRRIEILGIEDQ